MSDPAPVPDFHCFVCGRETDMAPNPPAKAVCEEHCPDHDYRYDRERRGIFCFVCEKEAPEDWHDE